MFGFAPLPCLVFFWVDYLSLIVAGQIFYQFQWDILLLEAGFLGIFLSPLILRLGRQEILRVRRGSCWSGCSSVWSSLQVL